MIVEFDKTHENPKDSQVLIALTGSAEYIEAELQQIVAECKNSYGKPIQGQIWTSEGSKQIITRLWKGRKY